jgi:uncharacterized membrane protein
MENKYVWAIIAFVIGYYIAKKRQEKAILEKIEAAKEELTTEFSTGIDNALAMAEQKGMSVTQVRQLLK